MAEQIRHSLSDYGKFHMQYMGYDFYDNHRQCLISKYALWHSHYELCLKMLHDNHIISRYTLKDREGWKNGIRIRYSK